MESIKKFIENLFIKEGYANIEIGQVFSVWKNKEENDFWIIDENFDFEKQQKVYDILKKSMDNLKKNTDNKKTYPYEKNTSVLCLKEVNTISDYEKEKAVAIENDPYYFKKYVLLYTLEDWIKIQSLELSNIQQFILNADNFKKFKEDNCCHFHDLLYKIAHKLPFLKIELENVEEYTDINTLVLDDENEIELENWVAKLYDRIEEVDNLIEEKIQTEDENV